MKATIGRTVIVNGISSNGSNKHPAVITRVWSDAEPSEETVLVNLTVFADCSVPMPQGSVRLFDTEEAALAEQEADPVGASIVCYWPAQV